MRNFPFIFYRDLLHTCMRGCRQGRCHYSLWLTPNGSQTYQSLAWQGGPIGLECRIIDKRKYHMLVIVDTSKLQAWHFCVGLVKKYFKKIALTFLNPMAKSPFPSITAEKAEKKVWLNSRAILILLVYLRSDLMSRGQYLLSMYHHFSNYNDILSLDQELFYPYDFQIPSDQIFHSWIEILSSPSPKSSPPKPNPNLKPKEVQNRKSNWDLGWH